MELYKEIEANCNSFISFFNKFTLKDFVNCGVGDLYLYHFGVGTWIRDNLLTEESDLFLLFKENKIKQKNDMSTIIIRRFHAHLIELLRKM